MSPMAVHVDVLRAPRSCRGKVRFTNVERAQEALVRLAEELHEGTISRKNERPLDVYRCSWCNRWHVGHRPLLGGGP